MTIIQDTPSADMPPVVSCPDWCDQGFHPWEQDGDEWVRHHEGALPFERAIGVRISAYAVDYWHDGILNRGAPCAILGDVSVDLAYLAAILDRLGWHGRRRLALRAS